MKIALEGRSGDIVPIIGEILKKQNHEVVYSNQSYFPTGSKQIQLVDNIINADADINILCNGRGYDEFLDNYFGRLGTPLVILTGGGTEAIQKLKKFTPYIFKVPDCIYPLDKFDSKLWAIYGYESRKREKLVQLAIEKLFELRDKRKKLLTHLVTDMYLKLEKDALKDLSF